MARVLSNAVALNMGYEPTLGGLTRPRGLPSNTTDSRASAQRPSR